MEHVLVLNADLGPLHRVSLRHAIRMLCRQVAVVHEAEPDIRLGIWPLPRVVRLVQYVVTRWRYTGGPSWSRPGVMARDGHRCGYCGGVATTVDHILPRARGGKKTWLNTVAACGRLQPAQGRPDAGRGADAAADHPARSGMGRPRHALMRAGGRDCRPALLGADVTRQHGCL